MGRLSSRSVLQKCDENGRDTYQEDRISGLLPDEVLAAILSLLTFKEAMTTSILSTRWRYMWTFITGNLSFTGKAVCDKAFDEEALRRDIYKYKARFVAGVNHVLKVLHRDTTQVNQFKVCFGLGASYSGNLSSWVKFAIEKRVRTLELNLTNFDGFSQCLPYAFPSVDKLKLLPPNYTYLIVHA